MVFYAFHGILRLYYGSVSSHDSLMPKNWIVWETRWSRSDVKAHTVKRMNHRFVSSIRDISKRFLHVIKKISFLSLTVWTHYYVVYYVAIVLWIWTLNFVFNTVLNIQIKYQTNYLIQPTHIFIHYECLDNVCLKEKLFVKFRGHVNFSFKMRIFWRPCRISDVIIFPEISSSILLSSGNLHFCHCHS